MCQDIILFIGSHCIVCVCKRPDHIVKEMVLRQRLGGSGGGEGGFPRAASMAMGGFYSMAINVVLSLSSSYNNKV